MRGRPSNPRKPAVSAASTWTKQVEAAVSTCEGLVNLVAIHGEAWRAGMLRYYAKRLGILLSQPPPGCQAKVAAFRKRIAKL